jgi:transaldolase / glucose-6-phosphate isomerase
MSSVKETAANAVKALQDHGQSVWLDFLARGFIVKGELQKLIDADGVRGVTSNPAIFEKAIAHSDEYDSDIGAMLQAHDRPVGELYERLAVKDIRAAADVLRPVFESTNRSDGFVSIEVSPYLAMDTQASIAEAKRLWSEVDRKNLMVKIPATGPGLPAIRALIAEGINVNITLLFSQHVYEQVVEAYLAGLEELAVKGRELAGVASVASFFVSRIDTAADKLLDAKIKEANDPDEKRRLAGLKGKVAIANAKLAYVRYLRLFAGERWKALQAKGAQPQRLLWASTGTKNKAYSDVLYVEELIGRNTINTMPPATLEAFRDHGRLRDSLQENVADAEQTLRELGRAGVSLDAITARLVEEGVQQFADAADKLLAALAKKRARLIGSALGTQSIRCAPDLQGSVGEMAEEWRRRGNIRRLFQRDKSLWTNGDEDRWLGWLDCIGQSHKEMERYAGFAQEVKREGFTDALLLGMGGSSLGPEVLAQIFGHKPGWPRLRILDSTDPAQIRAAQAKINLSSTLFIVSSKSGSTTEPNILNEYFYQHVAQTVGEAGRNFVAVTDPGSSLEATARKLQFRHVFHGVPSIGGRYSVLSAFGLVPAAVAGIDLGALLKSAQLMLRSCGPDVPPAENPGVQLGIVLGVAGTQGRDKVTIIASPRFAAFGAWAEQLIAESTGKNGKGLIPVDAEPLGAVDVYGPDRLFIHLRTASEEDAEQERLLAALEHARHPVVRIVVNSIEQIAQEFFRFEIAIAVAGAVLGINPFDQPDVEASKARTRELTAAFEKSGDLPAENPVVAGETIELYTDAANAQALRRAGADGGIESWLKAHLSRIRPGDYAALLAYVARDERHTTRLQELRVALRDKRCVATCLGFGPRFLHSTGQAYKGGPDSGVFLQITAEPSEDLPVPGQRISFGIVEAAQARGDFEVLAERGRRALRVHLKGGLENGLSALTDVFRRAVA